MSKKEKDELFKAKVKKTERPKGAAANNSDEEGVQWDPEIDMKKEKSKLFDILAQFVPQSEIFLSSKPQLKNTPITTTG